MTKEKLQYYTQIVDNKTVNVELLILCLANLEPRINLEAYMRTKYKNSCMGSNGCYEYQMKLYMEHRKHINNLLLGKYSMDAIKKMVNQIDKDNMITNKLCDSVVELIQSNEYCLTDS